VRNAVDIAAGLFLCSVSAQFESFSKRLVPEVVNFLSQSITTLILGDADMAKQGAETASHLDKLVDAKVTASDGRPDILAILCTGKITRASRQQLCFVALDMSAEIYTRQTSLLSFEECFAPLGQALHDAAAEVPASALKVSSFGL
jgi:nucleolar protein 14